VPGAEQAAARGSEDGPANRGDETHPQAPPVWVVHRRMAHHSAHSGYDRITEYLPNAHRLPALRLGSAERLVDGAFRRWLAPHCGVAYYQPKFVRDELALILHHRRQRRGIYHYLYGEDQFWLLGRLGRAAGRTLVATFHQPPAVLTGVLRRTEHLRRLDAVVLVGTNQRTFFESLVDSRAIHVVPHGVDVEYFRPAPRPRRDAVRHCLFVGSWLRDFETLRSVATALSAAAGRSVELTIVSEEENHDGLRGLDNVTLKSRIGELELLRLYQSADLLLLPMIDATANNTLLEAMACGTPAVISDVGAVRDYVDEGCACLVPPADPAAMVAGGLALLNDGARLAELRDAARHRAESFDWRSVARRLGAVYETLR
jgi:glycosyltransferase involved in cell wall biosynthesis